MEDLSRTEYPAMLTSLQPAQAVQLLQDRVRRIGKVNQEVADWLQERRRVEEQYVAGLRKLLLFKVPNSGSELGVFQPTWDAVIRSVDTIANSHHVYSERVEKDVETPLRAFQNKKEMANMGTISSNLQTMAHELDEAQQRVSRLGKKGGKANTQKVDTATAQLESATQQWESQAPFIFETLQALDELRVNHLRDVLTQLETHEVDQAARTQAAAEAMLNLILEVNTADEIQAFAQRATGGRHRLERQSTRQSSVAAASTAAPAQAARPGSGSGSGPSSAAAAATPAHAAAPAPAPAPAQVHEDNGSEHSSREAPPTESKLRSRIGTMLGRRRQSIQGFGQLSPSKGSSPFGRIGHSSHGRTVSPRASSHNLAESNHRLSSLAEAPDSPVPPSTADTRAHSSREGTTNGFGGGGGGAARSAAGSTSRPAAAAGTPATTFDDIFSVPPPPGPPPSHQASASASSSRALPPPPAKDAEGYSVPAAANDPISQAQRAASALGGSGEGGEEADHAFMLNIQQEPVADEDAKAKQAALSNVASTLSMAMPSRKGGTVRGRRDVRNTIYVPAPPPPPPPATVQEASSSLSSSGAPSGATSSFGTSALTATTTPTTATSPAATATASRSSTFASPTTPSRPSAVMALASEGSFAGTSDTQSVRSATSLSNAVHLKHADATGPGLSTSIIETVSAAFEDGELKTAKIAGEIAFAYNAEGQSKDTETIRINNFPLLEAIGPNRIFVQNTAAADEFTLATAHLQPRASVGFTFRAHGDAAALGAHCPLVLKPAWKPAGDKLGLLLQYRLNPALAGASLTLRNVVFLATYEGARASGVQTKPSGTHLKDKHLVYWRLSELHLTDAWAKIVCRVVGEQGAEPQPGHIEARWEYASSGGGGGGGGGGDAALLSGTDISISRQLSAEEAAAAEEVEEDDDDDEAEDPFADDGPKKKGKAVKTAAGSGWAAVPLVRQIVSGRYEAK